MQRTKRVSLIPNTTRALCAPIVAAGLALCLASCAVSSPLAVTSTGTGFESATRVALATPEDPESLNGRFVSAVTEALDREGVALDEDAALIADVSLAQSRASAGIVRGEGAKVEDPAEQDWLATPREKRRFDKCEAQRLRGTLVIYNRVDGSVAYRGTGQATECGFDDTDLEAFATALVSDALGTSGR